MENPLVRQNLSCDSFSASDSMSDPRSLSVSSSSSTSCSGTLSLLLLHYTMGSVLVFIILLSISGNILVCIAIYTDRKLRKLGNLFLVSLALADLFLATLVMTFAVANDMMGYWIFGSSFCEIWIAFDVMCCTASILNLAAISLDRFFHIKDPLSYERWMTKRMILMSVSGIWLTSALVSFVPISFGWHRPSASPNGATADHSLIPETWTSSSDRNSGRRIISSADPSAWLMFPEKQVSISSSDYSPTDAVRLPQCALDLTPVYAVVSSSISFYIPCVIMIGLYTRLYLYAKKHVRNIRSVTKSLQFDQEKNLTAAQGSGTFHSNKQHHASEHKAAITLGVIMGTFIFCWVPFFIANIIDAFCKTCVPVSLFKTLTWLGYFNSAMNPVIYSIFNTEFRDAFRRILISYAHNECCDRRRESRGTTDLLVTGKRVTPRYSTSEGPSPHHLHHHHQQQQQQQQLLKSKSGDANLFQSSQSLRSSLRDQETGNRSQSSSRLYNSVTGNHPESGDREATTPTIEVMQDRSIELSFFPSSGSTAIDQRHKISAI